MGLKTQQWSGTGWNMLEMEMVIKKLKEIGKKSPSIVHSTAIYICNLF